jgi:hypothetical protein
VVSLAPHQAPHALLRVKVASRKSLSTLATVDLAHIWAVTVPVLCAQVVSASSALAPPKIKLGYPFQLLKARVCLLLIVCVTVPIARRVTPEQELLIVLVVVRVRKLVPLTISAQVGEAFAMQMVFAPSNPNKVNIASRKISRESRHPFTAW